MGKYVNDGWGQQQNAVVRLIEHHKTPHLCLFARRKIKDGEEIKYDYGDSRNLFWRKKVCTRQHYLVLYMKVIVIW